MSALFDAKTATWKSVNGVTTMTVSNLTVGSGSNRAVLVPIFFSKTSLPSGITVTWDSGGTNQACTQVPNTSATTAGLTGVSVMYGLVAPTSGNKSLVISWTGALEAHACAISFTGVDQTNVATAFPNGNTNAGIFASPCSVTVASAIGNMVVGMFTQASSSWGTISGTTLAKDDTTGPNLAVASNYAAGAASVTLTAAFTGITQNIAAGCDVLAAGGGDTLYPQSVM